MTKPIEQRISDDKMNLVIWIDKLKDTVVKDNFKENLHLIEQYSSAVFQFGTVLVEQCRKQQLELKDSDKTQ